MKLPLLMKLSSRLHKGRRFHHTLKTPELVKASAASATSASRQATEAVVADLADLISGAQALDPALPPEAVVRAIWRHGSAVVWRNLRRGVGVSPCS
jgi:hypothetical protein